MAGHIWVVRRFSVTTLSRAEYAFKLARKGGLDFTTSCQFVGYVLEMIRQNGCSLSIKSVWEGALRSRHRYSLGRNRDNYLKGGKNLLSALAHDFRMEEGAAAEVIWDFMDEYNLWLGNKECDDVWLARRDGAGFMVNKVGTS